MSISHELSKSLFFEAKEILKAVPPVEQHCHTNFTDGKDSVEEMVLAAIKKGLKIIIITEHIQKKSAWIKDFIKQVKACQSKFAEKIEIFYGFESKLINYEGELDILPEFSKDNLILGAVHGYPLEGKSNEFYEFDELTKEKALELELNSILALVKNPQVDIIAHPLGIFEKNYGRAPPEIYEEEVKMMRKYSKIMDLNSKYSTNLFLFLTLCKEYDVKISIGSDAHSVEDVGKIIKRLEEVRP